MIGFAPNASVCPWHNPPATPKHKSPNKTVVTDHVLSLLSRNEKPPGVRSAKPVYCIRGGNTSSKCNISCQTVLCCTASFSCVPTLLSFCAGLLSGINVSCGRQYPLRDKWSFLETSIANLFRTHNTDSNCTVVDFFIFPVHEYSCTECARVVGTVSTRRAS